MKIVQRLLITWIFAGLASLNSFAAEAQPLASYHFIGASAFANSTNGTKIKEIWALPETVKFRDDVFQKLSRVALNALGNKSADPGEVALLRPLLDDLIASESLAEWRGTQKSDAALFVSARLNDERSQLWEKNLRQALKTSKPQDIKIENATGWETKAGAKFLKFLRAGKWTVVIVGPKQVSGEFLKQLGKSGSVSPAGNWLEAEVDWPRLKPFLPLDKAPFKLARTKFQISGKGENLRTTGQFIFPEKINWQSEPWRIPKEFIRDPLISFTAMRRIGAYLQKPIFPPQLVANPETNQVFFWGQSQMPFQFYGAMPVKDATNTLKKFGPQIAAAFNDDLARRDGGELDMASNHVDLIWKGLPIVGPFLHPARTNGADFLLGGLFPIAPSTNQAPPELFAQIAGRNDLVYYDWEITQERLGQWTMVGQLLPIFPKEPIISTNAALQNRMAPARMPELQWVGAVSKKLGNTVTEVTYKSPTELEFVRKSHIGLNSVELMLLSHWLAHPKFPYVNPFAVIPGTHPTTKPAAIPFPTPGGKP